MTPIEIRALDCLNGVSMRIASSGKRFRRDVNWELENELRTGIPFRMTRGQALYLWFLVDMYRRQIKDAEILGYAAHRKLTGELPPIYQEGNHRPLLSKKKLPKQERSAPAPESAGAAKVSAVPPGFEQECFQFGEG